MPADWSAGSGLSAVLGSSMHYGSRGRRIFEGMLEGRGLALTLACGGGDARERWRVEGGWAAGAQGRSAVRERGQRSGCMVSALACARQAFVDD